MREQVSLYLSAPTGLILFGIGLLGLFNIQLTLNNVFSVLTESLNASPGIDTAYYLGLALLGFWLTLNMQVRLAAALALGLVLGKIVFLNLFFHFGILLPLSVSVILLMLVFGKFEHA